MEVLNAYDVAIAGAGVTGNYLASQLSSHGYRVAVLEQHTTIGEPARCTGIVGAECFKRFPIFDGSVRAAVRSARICSPSGKELRLHREQVQAYIVDRPTFDRALAEKAQEQGVDYFLGCTVEHIAPAEDRVSVTTANGMTVQAKTAVVATGCSSRITEGLGLGRITDVIAGAQAEVTVHGVAEIEVYLDQTLAPGFFAWLVPTDGDRALAGLFSRAETAQCFTKLMTGLRRQGKVSPAGATPTFSAIPLRTLSRTSMRRVLVVGDAAGQVKPTSGGGIYYGLLCADMAAETLHHALASGDFSDASLLEYQKNWQNMLARELSLDYSARRLYERLSNRQIEAIFSIITSNGIHRSLLGAAELSFDWHGDAIIKGVKHLAPWRHLFSTEKHARERGEVG
ncbi:MAG: NAD(P)/FAD-dependent oxidoreductase [Chloroflexota bacterium]